MDEHLEMALAIFKEKLGVDLTMDPKTSSTPDDGRIEVSIVGSPEVFGSEKVAAAAGGGPSSASVSDEKCIEKKDQSPRAKSEEVVVLESDTVPQMQSTSNSVAVETKPVATENIHNSLLNWQWAYIDGIQLPAIQRGNELYLAVHNVQLKLLNRFPPGISNEVLKKYTMVSHRMTQMEGWVLNSINTVMKPCDLGCQLFTAEDELVQLKDVEHFYWNIKMINLIAMFGKYEEEINKWHDNISLMSLITAIKQHVQLEIDECKARIHKLETQMILSQAAAQAAATHSSPSTAGQNSLHNEGNVDINVYS